MFVYLGLGTNQGDRFANLKVAIARLDTLVAQLQTSAVYESAPMYVTDQPRFLNMAVSGTTMLDPFALLHSIKEIETDLGRVKKPNEPPYGPRPIDIDILLATTGAPSQAPGDAIVVDTPTLVIPHPRLAERAFVLLPLADLAGATDLRHPITGASISALASQVSEQDCIRLGLLTER